MSDVRARIELFEDKEFSLDYINPEKRSMASALSVKLTKGSRIEEVVIEYPLGNPRNPGTAEAVRRKIEKNLGLIFDKKMVEGIVNTVYTCDHMPVRDFMDLLWKGK